MERAALVCRTSSMYWVLAVIAAAVGSLPWLVFPGFIIVGTWICYSAHRYRQGVTSIDYRLKIVQQVREYNSINHQGGHVLDYNMYAQIDLVFTIPNSELSVLERSIQQMIVNQAAENRAYAARQQMHSTTEVVGHPLKAGGDFVPSETRNTEAHPDSASS